MKVRVLLLPVVVSFCYRSFGAQAQEELVYVAVDPCRIMDTRKTAFGNFSAGESRNIKVYGNAQELAIQGSTVDCLNPKPGGEQVTPARRGKALKTCANAEVRTPAECHAARACPASPGMTWAQRLKRVFNIDIEVCSRCGGSVKVIVGAPNRCIEEQDAIDRILAHLESKEQNTPALPHLAPPTRASPETLPVHGEILIQQ